MISLLAFVYVSSLLSGAQVFHWLGVKCCNLAGNLNDRAKPYIDFYSK